MLEFFTKKEYQEIANLFCLGKIIRLKYFKRGYQTPKAVVITPKRRFVIAKHHLSKQRTMVVDMKIVPRVALEHEINFLNYLKSLPVPHYIKSKNRSYLEDYKKDSVSVYKFIEGKQSKRLTSKMIYQLGQFVGEFHGLGSRYREPMRGRRRFYDLNPKVMNLMDRMVKKQTHPELKQVIEEVRLGVETHRLSKGLPKGPIHVDIKPDNELYRGEQLTGVIDFGNVYIDPFIFDVGKTIMWNCIKKGKIDKNMMSLFLKGYLTKRKLSRAEMDSLQRAILFAIYSQIWVDLYHVPIKYVPESYTLFLVRRFLPIARKLKAYGIK